MPEGMLFTSSFWVARYTMMPTAGPRRTKSSTILVGVFPILLTPV
jgi:hypothetical protein